MARLPIPGSDNGTWGDILNEYLSQSHKSDGMLKANSVTGTEIQDGSILEAQLASAVQTKLNTVAPVTSVASRTGDVTLTKSDVGLGNLDNTSDANKPISTATQTALDGKVAKGELVYNVKDYGAVGDGVTDDTAAIQAAIDASGDGGGTESYSVVFIPAGDYKVTSTITVKGNVCISGAGERTYIDFTAPTISDDNLFEWVGTAIDDFVIQDMRMRGASTDVGDRSGNGVGVNLHSTVNIERFKARRVRFERWRWGIRLYNNGAGSIDSPEIRECRFEACSYNGFFMNNTRNAKVIDNIIDCDRTGIGDEVAGLVGIWCAEMGSAAVGHIDLGVHNNHVYSAAYEGINIHAKHASVTGNNVYDCVQTGIVFEPFIQTLPDDEDAKTFSVISGNTVRGSNDNIVVRHDPMNNTRAPGRIAVTGNATAYGINGIRIGSSGSVEGPMDVVVSGNVCMDHAGTGLTAQNVRRVAFGANTAVGCAGAGLAVSEASKAISISGGCYNGTGDSASDGIRIADSSSYVTISGAVVDNCERSGVRVSGTANNVTISGLIALDDQGSPTMDNAVTVSSSGANIVVDGHPIVSGTVGSAYSGVDSVNGYGEETANAETPDAANWTTGDIVRFTDSGDGSGTGAYVLRTDGTNWHRLAGAENGVINAPKINQIRDANNVAILDLATTASAVNYLRIQNASTSGTPAFYAAGTDTNISLAINPKGTGKFQIYATAGNTPTIQAQGADTNVNLQLRSKGTGTISSWQESGNAGWNINGTDTDVGFNFTLKGAGTLQVGGNPVGVKVSVPASASATGIPGQWAADSNYIYVCTATDTWVRSVAATW